MTSTVKLISTVTGVFPGQRLDLYLSQAFPQYSRSFWKEQIVSERVFVNEKLEFHPQYRVKESDQVRAEVVEKEVQTEILAVPIPLEIVFENTEFLVINKPVGLVVHPAAAHQNDTLANGVKYYLQSKNLDNFGPERAGIVHRLDKETSGLLLVAKSAQALWQLSRLFAERKIHKEYLAVVKGQPISSFTVSKSIGRSRFDRQKFSQHTAKSRVAETQFQILQRSKSGYSLILAQPKTGRTHQIRVHLSEAGFPIVGDQIYGGESAERMLLHAYRLEFSLPGNDKSFVFEAKPDALMIREAAKRDIDLIN